MKKKQSSPGTIAAMIAGIVAALGFAAYSINSAMSPAPPPAKPAASSAPPASGTAAAPTGSTSSGGAGTASTAQAGSGSSTAPASNTPGSPSTNSPEAALAPNANPFYPIPKVTDRGGPATSKQPVAPTVVDQARVAANNQGTLPPSGPGNVGPMAIAPIAPAKPPELVGTLLGGRPSAVFRTDKAGVAIVPVGALVQGWKVIAVNHGEVFIKSEGRVVRIGVVGPQAAGTGFIQRGDRTSFIPRLADAAPPSSPSVTSLPINAIQPGEPIVGEAATAHADHPYEKFVPEAHSAVRPAQPAISRLPLNTIHPSEPVVATEPAQVVHSIQRAASGIDVLRSSQKPLGPVRPAESMAAAKTPVNAVHPNAPAIVSSAAAKPGHFVAQAAGALPAGRSLRPAESMAVMSQPVRTPSLPIVAETVHPRELHPTAAQIAETAILKPVRPSESMPAARQPFISVQSVDPVIVGRLAVNTVKESGNLAAEPRPALPSSANGFPISSVQSSEPTIGEGAAAKLTNLTGTSVQIAAADPAQQPIRTIHPAEWMASSRLATTPILPARAATPAVAAGQPIKSDRPVDSRDEPAKSPANRRMILTAAHPGILPETHQVEPVPTPPELGDGGRLRGELKDPAESDSSENVDSDRGSLEGERQLNTGSATAVTVSHTDKVAAAAKSRRKSSKKRAQAVKRHKSAKPANAAVLNGKAGKTAVSGNRK